MSNKKHESLDEIVFKERNKEYGAYYLRKVYKKYTTRSLLISLGFLLLAVLVPFFIYQQARSVNVEKSVAAEFTNIAKPPEEAPPPPPPPPPAEELEQKVKFTAPIVTTDSVEQGTVFNQDDLNTETTNFAVDTNTTIVVDNTDEVIEQVEMKVFTIVEEQPVFTGGDGEMFKFLTQNTKYPEVAKENNIQGIVFVEFVVNADGSISDVARKVGTKEVGAGCDEEAIRVIKMMPKWVPGKQSGKNVRVRVVLPVKFKLE